MVTESIRIGYLIVNIDIRTMVTQYTFPILTIHYALLRFNNIIVRVSDKNLCTIRDNENPNIRHEIMQIVHKETVNVLCQMKKKTIHLPFEIDMNHYSPRADNSNCNLSTSQPLDAKQRNNGTQRDEKKTKEKLEV